MNRRPLVQVHFFWIDSSIVIIHSYMGTSYIFVHRIFVQGDLVDFTCALHARVHRSFPYMPAGSVGCALRRTSRSSIVPVHSVHLFCFSGIFYIFYKCYFALLYFSFIFYKI